ncbi:MAG: hypothetical protein ACN2B6_01160 [Rickettsiales bacterium]
MSTMKMEACDYLVPKTKAEFDYQAGVYLCVLNVPHNPMWNDDVTRGWKSEKESKECQTK